MINFPMIKSIFIPNSNLRNVSIIQINVLLHLKIRNLVLIFIQIFENVLKRLRLSLGMELASLPSLPPSFLSLFLFSCHTLVESPWIICRIDFTFQGKFLCLALFSLSLPYAVCFSHLLNPGCSFPHYPVSHQPLCPKPSQNSSSAKCSRSKGLQRSQRWPMLDKGGFMPNTNVRILGGRKRKGVEVVMKVSFI